MTKKKNSTTGAGRSQLMAQAERLSEMGIEKAVTLFLDKEGNAGMVMTDSVSNVEAVFLFRQGEYFIFTTDDEDENNEE
jgi:hypothetical protein